MREHDFQIYMQRALLVLRRIDELEQLTLNTCYPYERRAVHEQYDEIREFIFRTVPRELPRETINMV